MDETVTAARRKRPHLRWGEGKPREPARYTVRARHPPGRTAAAAGRGRGPPGQCADTVHSRLRNCSAEPGGPPAEMLLRPLWSSMSEMTADNGLFSREGYGAPAIDPVR